MDHTQLGPRGVVVYQGPPHTDEWHAARAAGIGSSDIPVLLGFSRWQSPYDLWIEKTGRPMPPRSARLDEQAQWGLKLEDLLASHFAEVAGLRVERPPVIVAHRDLEWARCSPDGVAFGEPTDLALLELKTRSAWQARDWGDGVPDDVALQVQWQMFVTGIPLGWVAALVGGNEFHHYLLEADDDLAALMVDAAEKFLRLVREDVPPPPDASEACTAVLGRLWEPDPGKSVEVDLDLADAFTSRRPTLVQLIADAQRELDLIDNRMRAAIGDAETATFRGDRIATWKQNGVFAPARFALADPEAAARYMRDIPRLDVEALKLAEPALYQKYRSRALRVAGGRRRKKRGQGQ